MKLPITVKGSHSFYEPSNIFLVRTSCIYRLEENTFVLVLHNPLVFPHNLMPLYKFIPLPINFNFTGNISITPEVGINNMIAVGHSKSYQVISLTDLQSCIKMGETYVCNRRNVLLTDFTKTCLGALYLTNTRSIQCWCKFSMGRVQERSSICTATHKLCIPSGRLAPTVSAQMQRSLQGKPSGSTPAASSRPWTTSSRLMTVRSRSIPNGWDNSSSSQKKR